MTKAERARQLRYKKPALLTMGWEMILMKLDEIGETCGEVRYLIDEDEDTLLVALDGNDEELYEFKMAFADVEMKSELLHGQLMEQCRYDDDFGKTFDYCTVALIGNRYEVVGFDSDQEDYMSLCSYEQELAETEAGKRLMTLTKKEMISTIGQCMGITFAFQDLLQEYDKIDFTLKILKDENTTILKAVKKIDELYNVLEKEKLSWFTPESREFDKYTEVLPDRLWLE